jgi:hypothetical protein
MVLFARPPEFKTPNEIPRGLRGEYAIPRRVPYQDPPPTVLWGPNVMSDLNGMGWGLYGLDYNGFRSKLNAVYFWQCSVRVYRSADSTRPINPETQYETYIPGPTHDSFQDFSYCRYDNSIWIHASKIDTFLHTSAVYKVDANNGDVLRRIPSLASRYATGIAFDERSKLLYLVDRDTEGGTTNSKIYVTDTNGVYKRSHPLSNMGYSYAGARCLDFDQTYDPVNHPNPTLLLLWSCFSSGGVLDSCVLFELNPNAPDGSPLTIVHRALLPNLAGYVNNCRGVAWDPRDGSYWIGILQNPDNYIYKMAGWYTMMSVSDAAVTTIQAPRGQVPFGTPLAPRALIRLYNADTTNRTPVSVPVRMRIVGTTYDVTVNKVIYPRIEDTVGFANWTPAATGRFAVICSTGLAGDPVAANNVWVETVEVVRTDVGCLKIMAPVGTVNPGDPITPACSVYNYGTAAASYSVRMEIGADYIQYGGVTGHTPGTALYVTFPIWSAHPTGRVAVICSTQLGGDMVPSNDKKVDTVTVGALDAEARAIIAPAGPLDSGAIVIPQATVRNNSSVAVTFPVRFDIGAGYTDLQTVTGLSPGIDTVVNFLAWTANERGTLVTKCTTMLTGDGVPPNNIVTGTVTVGVLDVEAVSIVAPVGPLDSGTVVTPQAEVRNNGTASATFDVRFDIGGYTNTNTVTGLAAGKDTVVDFLAWTASGRGSVALKCTVALAGDMVPPNNVKTGTVMVAVHDVAALAIVAPSGLISPGSVSPQARVRNNGTDRPALVATFSIIGPSPYSRSLTLGPGLPQGVDTVITFPNWNATAGSYVARCSLYMPGDQVPANDTVSNTFTVSGGGNVDVGVVSIDAPAGTVDTLPQTPRATVRNFGQGTQTFDVVFAILDKNGSEVYRDDSIVRNLAQSTSFTLDFNVWGGHHDSGAYVARCSTALADANSTNDTLRGTFTVVYPAPPRHDVGATTIVAPIGLIDTLPKVPRGTVRNYGDVAEAFPVVFRILDSVGGEVYTNTKTAGPLGPNLSVTIDFDTWGGHHEPGNYTARCSTALGDTNPANDVVSSAFVVGLPPVGQHDVGSVAIVAPIGLIDTSPKVPRATVKNYGDVTETFPVVFRILDAMGSEVYSSTQIAGPVAPNTPTTVTFDVWGGHHEPGPYSARCSTAMGDTNPVNDTVSSAFTVGFPPVGQRDVAALAIVAPLPLIDTSPQTPKATVRNCGDVAEVIPVVFRILDNLGVEVYTSTKTAGPVTPRTSVTISFDVWGGHHALGHYTARCSTALGDTNPVNDTVSSAFTVTRHAPPPVGWVQMADVLFGAKMKRVKDGGALAYAVERDTESFIYAFKGNNRCEFYKYNVDANAWITKESIPAFGRAMRKKSVKKGGTLAEAYGKIYGTKGNNCLEFWEYDPGAVGTYPWTQKADVPMGMKNVKDGASVAKAEIGDTTWIYLLKGSNTPEFYRYNPLDNTWRTLPAAPYGRAGKLFKAGSCIAFDGNNTIYALKGSYNELFAYAIDSARWTQLTSLPLIGNMGRKKKVKDGAGIVHADRYLWALKGGNTLEYWNYSTDSDRWAQKEDIPIGTGKRVKGGGTLIRGDIYGYVAFWALKGNNTLEFWRYAPQRFLLSAGSELPQAQTGAVRPEFGCALAVMPNPITGSARISYSLSRPGPIRLSLYDITGKLVGRLAEGFAQAGVHTLGINSTELARGIYVLKLQTDDYGTTQKVIIE